MKQAVIPNFLRLVSVYILLIVANILLFPALNLSLNLSLALTFLLGFLLLFAIFSLTAQIDQKLKWFANRLFNLTILNLLFSLSLILPRQSYLEIQKPIINTHTISNLPVGSYLLKVEKININANIIGHASRYRNQRGVYSSFDHFFAIPIITRETGSRYSNWLVIKQGQRILNGSKADRVKKAFNLYRSYYLDSLKHFNPKYVHFYSVSDHATDGGKINGLYESVLATKKAADNIRILMPKYVDLAYYKREETNTIYWSIAITVFMLAIIAWLKAVLNKPKPLLTDHLNQPVAFKHRD